MSYAFIPDIAAEVAIPKDGTLSRVLHKDDRIRVVAFAFDTGQELTEHTAAVPAVVQVISGKVALGVDGDSIDMCPGAWTVMDAHLPHSVLAVEPTVLLLTLLK